MKVRDLDPLQLAVVINEDEFCNGNLYCGLINQKEKIAFHVKDGSRIGLDGSGELDCRLIKEGEEFVFKGGLLQLKKAETAKPEGVHPGELKVGQFGLVINIGDISDASEGDIIQRIVPAGHEGAQFKVVGAYVHYSAFPEDFRVRPYPIGSKIVPQADGSIVVEEPEVKWDDLEQGEFFVDHEGDLGIKSDDGNVVWLASSNQVKLGDSFDEVYGSLRRLATAEAAAIIAGQ